MSSGISLALFVVVVANDERLEHYCRMGLLAVAILHWIVFVLMLTSSDGSLSNQAPGALGNLAAAALTPAVF